MDVIGYLGIGSNMGDREKNILDAIKMISKKYKVIGYSSIYLTEPYGYREQDDFLNMVVKINTGGDDPFSILSYIKSVEKIMGRIDSVRWGPRLIDIDILYIEGIYIRTETLCIPHIYLLERDFVLIPMSELVDFITIDKNVYNINDYISGMKKVEIYKVRDEIPINVYI